MDKQSQRQKLKQQRSNLASAEAQNNSQKIIRQFLEILDLSSISSLHTYLPIEGQNEIDTWTLIENIWDNYPQINTATWHKPAQHYEPIWFNPKGLQKPVPKDFQFDLIIVPMVGFDDELYRLGFGGGNYDRFLAGQEKALKVGFCYDFGHLTSLPREPHDIPLDIIITEKRTIKSTL